MKKLWLAMLTLIACGPAMAQIEAGEWEFTSVSTSRLFPGPQNASFRRCIPKEEAANPDRWMANPGPQSDCKITPGAKTAQQLQLADGMPGREDARHRHRAHDGVDDGRRNRDERRGPGAEIRAAHESHRQAPWTLQGLIARGSVHV